MRQSLERPEKVIKSKLNDCHKDIPFDLSSMVRTFRDVFGRLGRFWTLGDMLGHLATFWVCFGTF